jgi:two-component system LytT family response regulator
MITAIVVDDESSQREELRAMVEDHQAFKVIGECKNALEAVKMINNEHPDVVFLDIRMPEISGIEMLDLLDKTNLPRIVFVTAYDEYAVEAFRQNAIDYLLKPINKERLAEALSRLLENCQPQQAVVDYFLTEPEFIDVNYAKTDYKIRVDDVIYASTKEAYGVVVIAENAEHNYNSRDTLDKLSKITDFKRCHGQFVVNMHKIQRLEKVPHKNAGVIYTGSGHTIPIGKMFMKDFF